MKTILIKISLVILGILLISTIILDGYSAIIFIRLGDATSIFDKFNVVIRYNIFEKLYLGAYLMWANAILLVAGVGMIINTFLRKK
jgi:hypothetical protein